MMISRILSTCVFEAASNSSTFIELPVGDLLAHRRIRRRDRSRPSVHRAVQRLGEDARRRGLAGAARADEEIGLREPVLLDGVLERPHDVLLPDDIVEGLRAVFAGENRVAHATTIECAICRLPMADWMTCATRRGLFLNSAIDNRAIGNFCCPSRMLGNLIGPEIKELIATRNFAALREALRTGRRPTSPSASPICAEEEQAVVFRLLPHAQATDVLEYLDSDAQQTVLKAMGHAEAARILNDMSRGRSHGAARGTAGRRGGADAAAALARGKGDRAVAAELSRGQRRPPDDAGFHQRSRRMDDPAGARSHPRARPATRRR